MRRAIMGFCSIFAFACLVFPSGSAQAWSLFPDRSCFTVKKDGKNKNICLSVCEGAGASSTACKEAKEQSAKVNPVAELIRKVANVVALIAGALAVIVIIIGGLQMITSLGNTEEIKRARGRILGAIAGLLIIAFAWTIIRLVTDFIL